MIRMIDMIGTIGTWQSRGMLSHRSHRSHLFGQNRGKSMSGAKETSPYTLPFLSQMGRRGLDLIGLRIYPEQNYLNSNYLLQRRKN